MKSGRKYFEVQNETPVKVTSDDEERGRWRFKLNKDNEAKRREPKRCEEKRRQEKNEAKTLKFKKNDYIRQGEQGVCYLVLHPQSR